jgi:hypothetical protein
MTLPTERRHRQRRRHDTVLIERTGSAAAFIDRQV